MIMIRIMQSFRIESSEMWQGNRRNDVAVKDTSVVSGSGDAAAVCWLRGTDASQPPRAAGSRRSEVKAEEPAQPARGT
ncbi:MAG: hypothetical protein A2045_16320 [Rhodocyclales bacterium GWA2_65_20]|nr:MAG: hypothetical protein A2045_16320 [Rhodocyclales bacterium GWA2_65_20]